MRFAIKLRSVVNVNGPIRSYACRYFSFFTNTSVSGRLFPVFFIYDLVPKFQKSNVLKKYRCEYPNSHESLHGSYIQNASLTSSILGIMQFCFKDKNKGEYPHLSFILRFIFQSSDIQCNMCCQTYARFQNCPDKNTSHFSFATGGHCSISGNDGRKLPRPELVSLFRRVLWGVTVRRLTGPTSRFLQHTLFNAHCPVTLS